MIFKYTTIGLTVACAVLSFKALTLSSDLAASQKALSDEKTRFSQYVADQAASIHTTASSDSAHTIEVLNDTQKEIDDKNITIANLSANNERMRSELTRLRQQRVATTPRDCEADRRRADMLAGLLDECRERYTTMGVAAFNARIRGGACQRLYDGYRINRDNKQLLSVTPTN